MEIIDANIALRYLLNDHAVFSAKVAYNQISGAIIHSFDKKVNKLCK